MGKKLAEIRVDLETCNKCGFCMAGCPLYQATGIEWNTARGRVALLLDVVNGNLALDADMVDPINTCLMCKGCVTHCPPGVKIDKIISTARAELVKTRGQSRLLSLIFRKMLPRPNLLHLLTVWMGRLSLVTLAKRLLWMIRPWPGLHHAVEVVPQFKGGSIRSRLASMLKAPAKAKVTAAYFLGCSHDMLYPEVAEATVRVLQNNGVKVLLAENYCCGLPAFANGDREAALKLAKANLKAFEGLKVDYIVSDCASCSSFLSEYQELFDGEPDAEAARIFSSKVRDVTQLLALVGLEADLSFFNRKVTYHDPCHLSRYLGVSQEPRGLITRIPGVTFIESRDADVCCGGAGTYSTTHSELSLKVLERKMEAFRESGADILVTSCPSCVLQLRHGTERFKVPVEVINLTELLDRVHKKG